MLRIVKGQPGTLSVPRDTRPTAATVTITRDRDGASIASAQACQLEADRVYYSLGAQSSIANLTASFSITDASGVSTVVVPVQVVGQRACSLADIRRLRPCDDVNRYPDELLDAARTSVEDALEAACGVSFIQREITFKADGSGNSELFSRYGRPVSLTSATIDGAAVTTSSVVIDEEGGVFVFKVGAGPWTLGRRNVTVTGTFGYTDTPGLVRQAVSEGVRHALVESRVDPRAVSTTNEDGTSSILVTAGVRGAMFGLPILNQCVSMYRTSFGVA